MTSSALHPGRAVLRALAETVHPLEFALAATPCTIGRAPGCDIVVAQQLSVSRLHATITWQNMYFVISDAGSSNGTFVNGRQLHTAYRLRHMDRIGLGNATPLVQFNDYDSTALDAPPLKFVRREHRFLYKNVPLDLSPNLTRLLMHLYTSIGAVCTRESCIRAIWNDATPDPDRVPLLHKEISELRDKFQAIDSSREVIKTRRGIGYYLDLELG